MIKKIILLLLFFIFTSTLQMFGAGILVDFLIIGKDTLRLEPDPYKERPYTISKFYHGEPDYITYWRLEDNRLYVVGIVDINRINHTADLNLIFGNDFINGKVFAYWVSGELIHGQGKRISFVDIESYESEHVFLFDKGIFIKSYEYDNSKTYKSIFTQNDDSLRSFISNAINWESLPSIDDSKKRVVLRIISGDEKNKFQVSILKGIDSLYNNEALRVAKLIPAWDVLYIHGKSRPTFWSFPIIFSNEMRLKYKRQ
jgi:hypothetical protein